jgi:hypothetical protein
VCPVAFWKEPEEEGGTVPSEQEVPGTMPASIMAARSGAIAPSGLAPPEEGTESPTAAPTVLDDSSAPQLFPVC